MSEEHIEAILAYHEVSKHHTEAFAAGPRTLDWANQPDPFRRYAGAAVIPLVRPAPGDEPPYEAGFRPDLTPPAVLDGESLSRLFFDALALSAWKEFQGERWALRVNPSSGNLHPTEGYLICGAVPGLSQTPLVAHYTPQEHALEVRARLSDRTWQALAEGVALQAGDCLPEHLILVGLSSVHWRAAWKYGERAFRYCQHDIGHALACLGIAAAGLGWEARLLDGPATDEIATLLGLADPAGAEPEQPGCLVAVYPHGQSVGGWKLTPGVLDIFRPLAWQGRPNALSRMHVEWRWLDAAAECTRKPATSLPAVARPAAPDAGAAPPTHPPGLRRIIHRRRSAVAMDTRTAIPRDAFYALLARTLPDRSPSPFGLLPWPARIHLALFVHRVTDLDPGLYLLVRDEAQADALRRALRPDFAWVPAPDAAGARLPLYQLASGDLRGMARRLSCGQDIASDGCFSLAMLAEFERPLREYGAWFYRRLFWECGMIGQVLYLEAECAGLRGTGIGCFFDDAVHGLLGCPDRRYQSLYHFTVGAPVDDARLLTLPAYAGAAHNLKG